MRSRVVLLTLCFIAAAFAQQDKSGGVSGTVVDSVTGAPLPRVHVTLDAVSGEERTFGAMTATDGTFSITGMTEGPYTLTMERIGFSMPTDAGAPENSPLVLLTDDKKVGLRLRMAPAGAISGHVTNAEGEPVEGVILKYETSTGAAEAGGTTDARGRFRIGGLAPGRYRVKAMPPNPYTPPERRTDGTADVQDAPTYYPGSLTYRQGTPIVVTDGVETSGVDIRLARVPVVEVSGKVEGAPANGFNAQLFITQGGGRGRSTAGIKPDGTFRLWRLFPGKYEVRAKWQVPGGRDLESAPAEFEVAGTNIDNLILRVIPPMDISGRVEFQDDGARPAPNVIPKIVLVNAGMGSGSTPVNIGADGSFHIAQLRAGRYRIVTDWNHVFVASMQMGSVAIDGSLLDLTNGIAGGELSIRVSSATGSLSGTVVDDNGVATGTALVALIFDGPGEGVQPRLGPVGPGGVYSFGSLAPGKYKLVATQEADGDFMLQSGRLDEYGDLTDSIEIHPGEKIAHDLKRRALDEK